MTEYDPDTVNRTDCKPWRDAETLRWAYHKKKLSSRATGSLLGASKNTVLYWMDKHDVQRDPGPYRDGPWRDKETLYSSYVTEGESMSELADRWDTSTATIFNWLNRHNITHRHEHPSGEDHPQYIDGRSPGVGDTEGLDLPMQECIRCGDEYKPSDHRQEYCSRGCWHDEMHLGSPSNRGSSWDNQRQKALERDGYECVVCGEGTLLHVHHIRPFREFGRERHEDANKLSNLLTLCPTHHADWEGIPLRPEGVE